MRWKALRKIDKIVNAAARCRVVPEVGCGVCIVSQRTTLADSLAAINNARSVDSAHINNARLSYLYKVHPCDEDDADADVLITTNITEMPNRNSRISVVHNRTDRRHTLGSFEYARIMCT